MLAGAATTEVVIPVMIRAVKASAVARMIFLLSGLFAERLRLTVPDLGPRWFARMRRCSEMPFEDGLDSRQLSRARLSARLIEVCRPVVGAQHLQRGRSDRR